jgi:predicted carbohydrate-binding protein with CBM5 and CBM33 domain
MTEMIDIKLLKRKEAQKKYFSRPDVKEKHKQYMQAYEKTRGKRIREYKRTPEAYAKVLDQTKYRYYVQTAINHVRYLYM